MTTYVEVQIHSCVHTTSCRYVHTRVSVHTVMDRLCLSPRAPYVDALTPDVLVFGDGDFGRY